MTFPHQLALVSLADLERLLEKAVANKESPGPVGVVGVGGAARYFDISRRKFYDLLDEEPALAEASFYIGTRRLWRIATLDDWAKRQEGKPSRPAAKEAA